VAAFNAYAQYGEDRTLFRIFGAGHCGTCVEVGAHDGRMGSNTLAFEQLGWETVLVEPIPSLAARIRLERPRAKLFECAVGPEHGEVVLTVPEGAETLASVSSNPSQVQRASHSSGQLDRIVVAQRTLDSVLEEAGLGTIDFVTIDVEGYELPVLEGFDLSRWKPRIVILEDNSSGTSLDVPLYMEAQGYVRFHSSGCNDWYCRPDDPLRTRIGVIRTEFIKALKAYKKVSVSLVRRSLN
jgi:FkbM family methyltransferase